MPPLYGDPTVKRAKHYAALIFISLDGRLSEAELAGGHDMSRHSLVFGE
jgi:hypothetical protein